ncbi:MAG: LCP family protein [Clostridia bacterium]|nr:LCP family protein [Clostridia bacterium]
MLRSIRNFIITLLISAAIFGIAAYYSSALLVECLGPMFGITVNNNIIDSTNDDTENNDNKTDQNDNQVSTFSMLVINTNYKPSKSQEYSKYDVDRYPLNEKQTIYTPDSKDAKRIEATDFIIVRGNSDKNEFSYTYIPACLVVSVKGKELTLNEVYRDLGVSFLCKKISAISGFEIEAYSIYDVEDVAYVIEYIDGVPYNVPVDIKQGNNVLLSKGQQNITGNDAQLLLEYQDYANTSQRSQMLVPLIKKIMAKATNKVYKIDLEALHRSSANKVDTSLTANDIASLSNLLYTYTTATIQDISYPGSYKNGDNGIVFVPNISSAINKFIKYR